MNKTQTIGAILRDYKQKSRATIPGLIPQLCEYAKRVLNRPTITTMADYDMDLIVEPVPTQRGA